MRLCACGCGGELVRSRFTRKSAWATRRFITGHNTAGTRKVENDFYLDSSTGYMRCGRTANLHQYQHRMVMEASLGRKLLSSEIVHHINGDKVDNRPENLEIMDRPSHMRSHWHERAKDCFGKLLPNKAVTA